MYERLFTWVVQQINHQLEVLSTRRIDSSVIGVLDIYGFEIFDNNRFGFGKNKIFVSPRFFDRLDIITALSGYSQDIRDCWLACPSFHMLTKSTKSLSHTHF